MIGGDGEVQYASPARTPVSTPDGTLAEIEIVSVRQHDNEGSSHDSFETGVGLACRLLGQSSHADFARQHLCKFDTCPFTDGELFFLVLSEELLILLLVASGRIKGTIKLVSKYSISLPHPASHG